MAKKVVASVISLVLVIGIVLGIVAVVHNKNNDDQQTSAHEKVVTAICKMTENQNLCHDTLNNVNANGDPKEYIRYGVKATANQFISTMNMSDRLPVENRYTEEMKTSVKDCQKWMQFALDDLEETLSTMGNDSNIYTVSDREDDLMNWLGGVLAFKETCLVQLEEKQENDQYKVLQDLQAGGLQNATDLTHMVLDIVSGISNIIEDLNINVQPTQRRLLASDDGYPTWLSASDRKLLALPHNGGIKPNAVVAQDGSGQYNTINDALRFYPKNYKGRYTIYVKAGTYREHVIVEKHMQNVFMYGDGPTKTSVTGDVSVIFNKTDTWRTATFSVEGNGFMAKEMKFENTAGPVGEQAVALRVQSEMSAFYHCHILGNQDTLYYQAHRQFYRNCVISGTIDFIFGLGRALIQDSEIIVRKPSENKTTNIVTADGRTYPKNTTGLVIQNCKIVPDVELIPVRFKIKSYLGRSWKPYARTVIMESYIDDFIQPEGWARWNDTHSQLDTTFLAEYNNHGPGAATNGRVKEKGVHVINRKRAATFTADRFVSANYGWLRRLGVPHYLGFHQQ
ncbi:Pectinesterase [Quillaja saponaria]|uniref:Pectinesterase n=1 Tax=Quillaja saponaria TaxID=32244 RepID=A0AAD7Q428_QUISA|nr:Pectinesterase [Quillaja saponaria]KAJ7974510.1 Pectinesterase [Quillaja saponaria]